MSATLGALIQRVQPDWSGEVLAVNDALEGNPEKINDDPYGEGWLVKVKLSDPSETESLMNASDYEASLDA